MALVIIQAPALSAAAKKRVGDQVITALHNEDVHASSVVVLFRAEDSDVYLDGGLLFESSPKATTAVSAPVTAPSPRLAPPSPEPPAAAVNLQELTLPAGATTIQLLPAPATR